MREVQAFEEWLKQVSERWIAPALKMASGNGKVGVPLAMVGDLMKVKFNARSLGEYVLVWMEKEGLATVDKETETIYFNGDKHEE